MLLTPTYEVIKMKVLMRRNGDRGFRERARGLARAIARQMFKILKFWHFGLRMEGPNFEVFKHLRAIPRARPSASVRKILGSQDTITRFILITSYVGFRGIGQLLQ